MAWVIPLMLAYIPGLLIGFLAFTLLTLRSSAPGLDPTCAVGSVGGRVTHSGAG
jgi:xanthosine utilization system XapX-like protein